MIWSGISIFQQKTVDLLCPGAVIILKEEKNEHIFAASELYDRLLNPISRMFVEKFMVNPKYLFVHTMSEAKSVHTTFSDHSLCPSIYHKNTS